MSGPVWIRRWLAGLALLMLGATGWVVATNAGEIAGAGSVLANASAAAWSTHHPPGEHPPQDPEGQEQPDGQGDDSDQEDPDGQGEDDPGQEEPDGQAPPDGQDDGADSGPDEGGQDGEEAAAGCAPDGLPLHDGEQEGQRCAQTALGEVPDPSAIPAVLITSPEDGATLAAGEPFDVTAAVADLTTGNFANPDQDYFQQPQQLDDDGRVLGHAHVAIQQLSQDDQGTPAAQDLAFFLGLNEPAEEGQLAAAVPGLTEPGEYRIQVNTASASHQPVASPVARHMAPIDVIRVRVVADEGEADTEELGQEAIPAAARTVTQEPGDGVPPAPSGPSDTRGGGGGPSAGGGGAGDGQPPPPVTGPPAAPDASAGQDAPDRGRPAAGEGGWVNGWVVTAGLLIAAGLALLAFFGHDRRRRAARKPKRYQGRHLDEDDVQLVPEPADEGASGTLADGLRRIHPAPSASDPATRAKDEP